LKLIEAANVGDQWIVGRALFGLEYLSNSVRVKKVRAKAVNRFGRKCDDATMLDELGGLFWRLGKNRLHAREFRPKAIQSAKAIRLKEASRQVRFDC